MAYHAELSPSSEFRWAGAGGCPASIQQSRGKPNKSSPAARQGTAEHLVVGDCLEKGLDPATFLGRTVVFYCEFDEPNKEIEAYQCDVANIAAVIIAAEITLDAEAIERCTAYVNYVRERVAVTGGDLYVEQKLPIDHITGECDATGTGDAVIVAGTECDSIDYKSGSKRVYAYNVITPAVVDPITGEVLEPAVIDPNGQLAMYAHGALRKFDMFGDIKTVRLTIVQPRINHISEFVISVDDLNAYIAKVSAGAKVALGPNPPFNPTGDNCYYCTGRLDCAAREAVIFDAAIAELPDAETAGSTKRVGVVDIGVAYSMLPLVKRWMSDVQEAVMADLDNGRQVLDAQGQPFKLVTGKQGNRAWESEDAVVAAVSAMNLGRVMYAQKLLSPTEAEKLAGDRKKRNAEKPTAKPAIGPIKWAKLQELIVRAPGKPEIAYASDPRPVYHPVDDSPELFAAIPAVEIDLF